MKKNHLLILIILIISNLNAQYNHCTNARLKQVVFSDTTMKDVQYGAALNNNGVMQDLYMTVIEPKNDTAALRPVAIMAFGGAFINGQRSDLNAFCKTFAQSGYTAITIDYRIGYPLRFDSLDVTVKGFKKAAFRGAQDMRAALQFLYKSARNGNPYHIDTNYIISGGGSSGAILSMFNAYYKPNLLSVEDSDIMNSIGGINGNTSNAGYPHDVFGLINVVGALNDTNFLQSGDVPIASCHGTNDNTVPYGTGYPYNINVLPVSHGSSIIKIRANNVGIPNTLHTTPGAGHTNIDYVGCIFNILDFYHGLICNYTSSVAEVVQNSTRLYPNPVENLLNIELEDNIQSVQIFTVDGKFINTYHQKSIDLSNYKSGIYFIEITNSKGQIIRKKIVKA